MLVAGLRSATGASRILLQAVDAGTIEPLVSVATMLEYEAVLTRTEQLIAMGLTRTAVDDYLDEFMIRAEEVSPYYNHGGIARDPNDDKFVTAALNGNAEAIISFNLRDYVRAMAGLLALEFLFVAQATFCGDWHGVHQQLRASDSSVIDGGCESDRGERFRFG